MVVGTAVTAGSDASSIAGATDVKASTTIVFVTSDDIVSAVVDSGTLETLSLSLLLLLSPHEQLDTKISSAQITAKMLF